MKKVFVTLGVMIKKMRKFFIVLGVLTVASLLLIPLIIDAVKTQIAFNGGPPLEISNVIVIKYKGHTYLSFGEGVVHDPDCEFCKKRGDE